MIKQTFYFLQSKSSSKTLLVLRRIRKIIMNRTGTAIADKLKEEQDYSSCWCFLFIDETRLEAKVVHKGRGKFKILNDEYGGKYVNKIIDASDIVHCKVVDD